MIKTSLAGAALCAAIPSVAVAQAMAMPDMVMPPLARDHDVGRAPVAKAAASNTQSPSTSDDPKLGKRMSGMPASTMSDAMMQVLFTEGSGTSRLPAMDRMRAIHVQAGDWMLMMHGYAWASWTDQGGPRGHKQAFVQSMGMVEASRPIASKTRLTLRTMVSTDPLMGKRGYPDLFATGETAHGLALVDRQHPHDLLMEVSGRIEQSVSAGAVFLYAGLPGEPALGPSAFMHRGSARFDPEAPITHHWFDSTHISYGVVTGGWASRRWQLEASAFKGREPDENRYNIETPRLDSWSVRGTWTPSPIWSAELSYGELHSPEALHPERNERRLIASAGYSSGTLDMTAAYSRKAISGGHILPAWLFEASFEVTSRHAVFGRFERVRNDELFEREAQLGYAVPLQGKPVHVSKFTAGYAYTLPLGRALSVALGGAASAYAKPQALEASYGHHPHSLTLFAKFMLGHEGDGRRGAARRL